MGHRVANPEADLICYVGKVLLAFEDNRSAPREEMLPCGRRL
jgi:hypothetical protein